MPARVAARFTIRATPLSVSRDSATWSWRSTGRKTGPDSIRRSLTPGSQCADGTRLGVLSPGDADLPALAFLVGLRAAQLHPKPGFRLPAGSTSSDTSSLRRKPPAKPSRSRARSRRPASVPPGNREQAPEARWSPPAPFDRRRCQGSCECQTSSLVRPIPGRGRRLAAHPVRLRDRRQPPLNRRRLCAGVRHRGQVDRDGLCGCWQRLELLGLAPACEVGPVGTICAHRVRGFRRLDKFARGAAHTNATISACVAELTCRATSSSVPRIEGAVRPRAHGSGPAPVAAADLPTG